MRFACWITKATDTLRIYNTDCFSTAKITHRHNFQHSIRLHLVIRGTCRSQRSSRLRRGSAVVHLLGLRVRIPTRAWMSARYECCVLSGRGLCEDPITRQEKSYRLPCVNLFHLETSKWGGPGPSRAVGPKKEKTNIRNLLNVSILVVPLYKSMSFYNASNLNWYMTYTQ
jgi:hypothetical protein